MFFRYSWPKRQGLPDSIFKSSYNLSKILNYLPKYPFSSILHLYDPHRASEMDQSDPCYLPSRFLLDLLSKDGWLLLPRKSRQPWIKSLVVPPDVQPFPPSFLLLLLILIFFLVLRQKSFWDPTQPEMFMRWSHQWMRPINKGSPFGQMCQFPFFHLFARIFFVLFRKLNIFTTKNWQNITNFSRNLQSLNIYLLSILIQYKV